MIFANLNVLGYKIYQRDGREPVKRNWRHINRCDIFNRHLIVHTEKEPNLAVNSENVLGLRCDVSKQDDVSAFLAADKMLNFL